jgi:hypothetical protein
MESVSTPLSESLSSFTLSRSSCSPPLGLSLEPHSVEQPQPPRRRQYSKFESLPPELIEEISFNFLRSNSSNIGPPKGLTNLLLISKRFQQVLSLKSNKGFYSDLFKERFDWKGIERRWNFMRNIEEKREKKWLLLQQTCSTTKPSDSIFLNPTSSFSSTSSSLSSSPWDPLTNRDYALELIRRCQVLTLMRKSSEKGGLLINQGSSRPTSPRLMSFTPTRGKTKLSEPDELTSNLWTCYLMLIENDDKNLHHLLEYARLKDYMRLFYRHSLLAEALNPGWPRQTPGRALGLWIGWLAGDDLLSETPRESEEKFFVLKPYVFAAHKFDGFMAPWTIKNLPVSHQDFPTLPPPDGSPYLADLRPRTFAQLVTHVGDRKLELSPPNLSHAAIFSFFYRVEQSPEVQDDLLVQGNNTPAQPHGPGGGGLVGGLTLQSRPSKTLLPVLESRIHDKDFIRLASCIDPYYSKGLPKLFTRGELDGNWEGRFSFFDFDSYRDMLGGRMRSLYEGPFGDQPQVWKLQEIVVKLGGQSTRGGTGPVLNAGFEYGQGVPTTTSSTRRPTLNQTRSNSNSFRATSLSQSPPPTARRRRTASTGGTTDSTTTIVEIEEEVIGEAEGGGGLNGEERATKKKRTSLWEQDNDGDYDTFLEGESEGDDNYEILLTGSGHSAWGQFNLKGRVRQWDGMFTIIKEYTPDSRGRWIYRGYRVGDSLVGRWRDTHTLVFFFFSIM